MPKPFRVQALEHFKDSNDDPLRAYVAFGLYIDAECKWASDQPTWPTEAKTKHFYNSTIPHSIEHYEKGADDVLVDFANNIVAEERSDFLQKAIDAYKAEAAKSSDGFWRGVWQAAIGALVWSTVLIAATVISHRLGVDVLEAYQKAAGIYIQQTPSSNDALKVRRGAPNSQ